MTPWHMDTLTVVKDKHSQLEEAWDNREFSLFVQPKIALSTYQVVGVECLLRWTRGQHVFSPAKFLPHIRALPQRDKFTQFVVSEGVSIMRSLDEVGFVGTVSINIDVDELNDNIIDFIIAQVRRYKGSNVLEVEVTEHSSMFEQPHLISGLVRLRDAGIHIALDDFGTGYSNYSVLDRIPFDTLKLDKSFIQSGSILTDTIINQIVELAALMHKQLIIEGVETRHQIERCQQLDKVWVQGFEVAKPMPLNQFIGQLA